MPRDTAGEATGRQTGVGVFPRVGKLELRVQQDQQGQFRTEILERYQRSEKALVGR